MSKLNKISDKELKTYCRDNFFADGNITVIRMGNNAACSFDVEYDRYEGRKHSVTVFFSDQHIMANNIDIESGDERKWQNYLASRQ